MFHFTEMRHFTEGAINDTVFNVQFYNNIWRKVLEVLFSEMFILGVLL